MKIQSNITFLKKETTEFPSGFAKMGFKRVNPGQAHTAKAKNTQGAINKEDDFKKSSLGLASEANENEIRGIYRCSISNTIFNDLTPSELILRIVYYIIGSDGRINLEAIEQVRKFINIKDVRYNAHVHRILDLLKNEANFRKLIENIDAPGTKEETSTVRRFIRIVLRIREDKEITKIHARRAVLSAVLSDLRQEEVGSCYGTAIAICVHDTLPHLMVEDLTEVLERGYFVRKRKTTDGKIEEKFYLGENLSLNGEIQQLSWKALQETCERLSADYPDPIFKNILAIIAKDIKGRYLSLLWKTIDAVISNAIRQEHGISPDDLILADSLENLSKEINELSVEASLNNDAALDKKVQALVEQYDKKAQLLGEKRFQVEDYEKIKEKIESVLYMEVTGYNILTKGWEYAIMSAELRAIEREQEISSKQTPPALRAMFQEALFNKDRGELFVNEMRRVLNILDSKKNELNKDQQEQVLACLLRIGDTMKDITNKRITVQTISRNDGYTFHVLAYTTGDKFKYLWEEENEFTGAVLGCFAEAFQEVMREGQIDDEVRVFLIGLKGILGDELKSARFRNSVKSFLINAIYSRPLPCRKANYGYIWNRVFSVYFNQEYVRQILSIEKDNSIVEVLQLRGGSKVGEVDREEVEGFDQAIQSAGEFAILGTSITALTAFIATANLRMSELGLLSVAAAAGIVLCRNIWEDGYVHMIIPESIKARYDVESLKHYIEASRIIYKAVKKHENWVKYPLNIIGHVCNLMPFNETLMQIVKSDSDIEEYICSAIKNPEKTVMVLMDLNFKKSCYLGFELGGGSIRKIALDSGFKETSRSNIDFFFSGAASIPVAAYHSIDQKIRDYKV